MIITVILGVIEADAGWSVGAPETGLAAVDRDLLVDRDGHPWVPPSALAGSLRAHLAEHAADEDLMGSRPPDPSGDELPERSGEISEHPGGKRLKPSRLWLLGTRIRDRGRDAAPSTEVVAATAIDPRRRAALPTSLRHTRQVGRDSRIELYLQHDGPLADTDLQLLATWRPSIGRDRTRGGGSARLTRLAHRAYDLDDAGQLLAWLRSTGVDRFTGLTDITIPEPPDTMVLSADFEIVDPLHLGTGSDRTKAENGRKSTQAISRTRGGRPLIPGSTWKGLFRARTGYILRSRFGDAAACTQQTGCGQCRLCDLFGSAGRRGRLAFRDSALSKAHTTSRTQAAIDRVTGGARDKLLFTRQIVAAGRLTLLIQALEPVASWERNLLLHVVRDLHDGLIGIGGGAQRGDGTIRLSDQSLLADLQPVTEETSS
ncbi:RAMP superfamily CRISPR-associated protein [Actinomadura sp. NPDC048955]|uniref:RAMP superfamily CRISPR-associated protein n=1 Tax=Actinomadura sp. NPDC048955 TaxID=3158228 RepID=UPI0033FBBE8A